MNIKQKLLIFTLSLLSVVSFWSPAVLAVTCGGVETSIVSCPQTGGSTPQSSGVWGILLVALNIMTAGIGILAVGGLIYGAVLYTTASQAADQVQKAKEVIRNVIIGIIAYGLMYLGLNFLIPGGIFT